MEARLRKQGESIEQTNKEIATFSIAEPTQAAKEDSWEREPDLSVLKLNSSGLVAKSSVAEAIAGWLEEASCEGEKAKLEGPNLGNNFVLQFSGCSVLAARRSKKAHSLLRDAGGQWRELKVQAPSGESIDLYVGIDKKPKQLQTERAGNRLLKHLEAKHSGQDFGLVRREGMVTWKWQPLARVVPHHDGHCDVEWNNLVKPKCDSFFTIDKDAAKEAVLFRGAGASAGVQWGV